MPSIHHAPYPYTFRNPYNVPDAEADLAYFAGGALVCVTIAVWAVEGQRRFD